MVSGSGQMRLALDRLEIDLPELVLGPIKYDIGEAVQLLRPGEKACVEREYEIQVSPRVKERCLLLSNGERIIVTERKKLALPVGIDGILRGTCPGVYEWLSHVEIERAKQTLGTKSVSATWKDSFSYHSRDDTGLPEEGLRAPQLGALHAVGAHWSLSSTPATIVMPTGTGKTETMLAILVAQRINKLLVAVPSKALRSQIAGKFRSLGKLRSLGVVPNSIANPVVGIARRRPKNEAELQLFKDCNVVVGVVSSLSGGTATNFLDRIAGIMDVLVVDEAHHVKASTWQILRQSFNDKKVLQFTATPFRGDGELVDGKVIYSYPLKQAQADGYFQKIEFLPVYKVDFDAGDEEIAKVAVGRLREDIAKGLPHQVIARCGRKDRAESVCEIYERIAADLKPILIHSDIEDNDERVAKVRSGEAKIVVCVNMLGEGIDIPQLKIAAVHDLHQSLAVLLQFVGRITRGGDGDLGNASVVANIAVPSIPNALERLYSEDADWNLLLREFSSEAAHEHAEFLKFLENSRSFDESKSHSEDRISPSSLRPVFSTLFYRCAKFHPKRFFQGLPDRYELVDVWLNEPEHTLYFAVRLRETVRWSNSQEMRQLEWHLFVLHHDQATRLLYLASTDKASDHGALADAVGAQERMSGEEMFRPLGRIGRLVFNNLGVTKHGRRNLSFAMYTGVDVRQALSETEKKGSRKSNISGYGWEDGKQITIGCSYKGRVWSKAAGTIPKFIKWAHGVGEKLVDPTISTKDIIANVLIPDYAERLPDAGILSIEWPVELLGRSEDQISIRIPGREFDFLDSDIKFTNAKPVDGVVEFEVTAGERDTPVGQFRMRVEGRAGFTIESLYGTPKIVIGSKESDLAAFFGDYPPLIRFVDLSELDGNILLRAEDAGTVEIPSDRLEPWDWSSVDITKESLWKDGARRLDSIQWSVAQNFINAGFSLVFDDDGPNEIADLICMKHDDGFIRLVLVHCKFSGSEIPGARVADVVEVASQAVRSARWPGRFKELVRHLQLRERRHKPTPGRTSYLHGAPPQLVAFQRSSRFQEVRPAVLIVQPGLSKSKLTREQSVVLGAAAAYLKQTIGIELEVVCSA